MPKSKKKEMQSALHSYLQAKGVDSKMVTKGNSYSVYVPDTVDIKKVLQELRDLKKSN